MGIVFALVLFGCSDDGSACQPLLAEPKHYISRALCEADEEAALQSHAAAQADFPTVATRCLQTGTVSIVARGAKDQIARVSAPTHRSLAPPRFGR